MELEDLLIKSGAVMFGDFILTSGKRSNYYINIKKATTDPEILRKIASGFSKFVKNEKIAGIELGSVPLAVALSLETGNKYIIIRKESKTHGTQSLIEGDLEKGEEVIIVEDVMTTGQSIIRAAKIVREMGGIVKKVLVVVDREEGGMENLRNENLEAISLVKVSNLLKKVKT